MVKINEIIQIPYGTFKCVESLGTSALGIETAVVSKLPTWRDLSPQGLYYRISPSSNLKILKQLTNYNQEGFTALKNEHDILKSVSHKRLPRIVGSSIQKHQSSFYIRDRIKGKTFSELIEAKLIEAKLIEAKLIEAKLIEAKLIEAKLIEAKLIESETEVTSLSILNWIEQSCKLLGYLHDRNIYHKDISPSNIVLYQNKIHFIDLESYCGTSLYQAPELQNDDSIKPYSQQSDLYALGRTFQHFLFGKGWEDEFPETQLKWKTKVSPQVAELLDFLTQEDPSKRPVSARHVLETTRKFASQKRKEVKRILLMSVAAATISSVISSGLRVSGTLQKTELKAYDTMVAAGSAIHPESRDNRMVIITIDEKDYDYQASHKEENMKPLGDESISDAALEKLLKRLLNDPAARPYTIGLDLRRDRAIPSGYPWLQQTIRNGEANSLFFVCHLPSDDTGSKAFSPPHSIDKYSSAVTFSDFPAGHDSADSGTIRRALLALDHYDTVCPAFNSLALAISTHYLRQKGNTADWNFDTGNFEIEQLNQKTVVPILPERLNVGGYRLPLAEGFGNQVLINYRRRRQGPKDLATQISLREVLQGSYSADTFHEKIVILGITRQSSPQIEDYHRVPYGNERLPGVFVHAHIVSQLVSQVEEGRRPIQALSQKRGDIIVTLSCALFTSLLIVGVGRRNNTTAYYLFGILGSGLSIAIAFFVVFIVYAYWLPLVPALIAWSTTSLTLFLRLKYEEENPYLY